MNHRRLSPAVAALAIVCLAQDSPPSFAQDRPTFRAGVALVPITAVVRDSKSRLVRDLDRDDFQVFENSQPRPILDFRATDRGPLRLALLVDTSGSMRGSNLVRGKRVVDRLLDSMTAADEAALFTFDNTFRQATPFTNEPSSIRNALGLSEGWGLTSIYDAIADTAKRLAEQRGDRRAVVAITDGVDTSSRLNPAEVSALASAIDVPVYVIAIGGRQALDTTEGVSDAALSDLAYWTGGDLFYAMEPEQSDKAIGALISELRQQYFLAIESSASTGWYRLEVTTKRRDLKVRTRGGYFSASLVP